MENFTMKLTFESEMIVTVQAQDEKHAEEKIKKDFQNKIVEPNGEYIKKIEHIKV